MKFKEIQNYPSIGAVTTTPELAKVDPGNRMHLTTIDNEKNYS
jgi:hypothetical protein